jgi:hypothetical protein
MMAGLGCLEYRPSKSHGNFVCDILITLSEVKISQTNEQESTQIIEK